jgi:hypothetical protein
LGDFEKAVYDQSKFPDLRVGVPRHRRIGVFAGQ